MAATPAAVASAFGVQLPIAAASAQPAPRAVLAGHPGGVRDIAFAPDGATVASVGADRKLRLWSTFGGQPLAQLTASDEKGEPLSLFRVAFTPDGGTVAAGVGDGSVWFWPVGGGPPSHLGDGPEVSCLAFSADGHRLAVGAADGTVRLWDLVNHRGLRTLYGHQGMVSALAFSPDGDALASSAWDGRVFLWDVPRGRKTDTLDGGGIGLDLTFSPEGNQLVMAGPLGLHFWDLARGGGWTALGKAAAVRDVLFSPDGRHLAAATADGTDWRLPLPDHRELPAFRAPTRPSLVALSPDTRLFASAPFDGDAITLWAVPAA